MKPRNRRAHIAARPMDARRRGQATAAARCHFLSPFAKRSFLLMARCVTLALAASLLVAAPAGAATNGWGTASSIGRDGLVLVALGLPAVEGDWKGTKQAAFSIGATDLVTEALKRTIHEERPD